MSKTEIYEELATMFEYEGTPEEVLMTGLSSEVGEVQAEWLKERRKDRPDSDRTEHLLDELSDVLWYVSRIAARRGTNLHALMRRNIVKLEERELNGK